MPRRASSSTHPAWLIAVIAFILGVTGGGYWIYSQISDPYRTLAALPIGAYLENSNSLRGNVYRVSGTVENQLGWSPSAGRLYSVDLDGSSDVLPLLVPAAFNAVNLQKGQQFTFEVEVGERGILRAKSLRKV